MPDVHTLIPTTEASTNTLGITFSASVEVQFSIVPLQLVNNVIENLMLYKVDSVGIYINKGPFYAIIPWGSIVLIKF